MVQRLSCRGKRGEWGFLRCGSQLLERNPRRVIGSGMARKVEGGNMEGVYHGLTDLLGKITAGGRVKLCHGGQGRRPADS